MRTVPHVRLLDAATELARLLALRGDGDAEVRKQHRVRVQAVQVDLVVSRPRRVPRQRLVQHACDRAKAWPKRSERIAAHRSLITKFRCRLALC